MRNLYLILLFFTLITNSQIQGEAEVYLTGDKVEATFDGGGIENFQKFVSDNFDMSLVTQSEKIETSFVINELGELKNVKILNFKTIEVATEMIRVLNLSPKWQPSKVGGIPKSITINFPFNFVKSNEEFDKNKFNSSSVEKPPY